MAARKSTTASTSHALRIGSADGRVLAGFAGSVRFVESRTTRGKATGHRITIRSADTSGDGTLAFVGGAPATSVTLNRDETSAILSSIGVDPTTTTAATLAGLPAWNDWRGAILAGTRDLSGFTLALPESGASVRIDATDATISARFAVLTGRTVA